MIVKCQFPLGGTAQILIYDKSRTVTWLQDVTPEWKLLFNGKLKIYCKAHLEGTVLVVDDLVEDQDW